MVREGAEETCKSTAIFEERQKRPVFPAISLKSGKEQRQKESELPSSLGDNRLLELGRKWELLGRWGIYKIGSSYTDACKSRLDGDAVAVPFHPLPTTDSVPHLCVNPRGMLLSTMLMQMMAQSFLKVQVDKEPSTLKTLIR